MYGYSGTDDLYGDIGEDELYGGIGNDQMFGDAGSDYLYDVTGVDFLNGGADIDTVYCADGDGLDTWLGDWVFHGDLDGDGRDEGNEYTIYGSADYSVYEPDFPQDAGNFPHYQAVN
jgi:hypothetical protein